MIVVVIVAVMVVGIARTIIMPVLTSAIVFVGNLTVVVTATPAAPVTMGMNNRYVQAKNRQ